MFRLSVQILNGDNMVFLDKYGWPVERTKGYKFFNFIRLLVHTRKVCRGYWNGFKIVQYKLKESVHESPRT